MTPMAFISPLIIINYSIVSPEYYASFPFLASKLADKWLESNPPKPCIKPFHLADNIKNKFHPDWKLTLNL